VWDGLVTFLILRGLGLFMKLRLPDEVLEVGDVAIHNEEVYPSEALTRVGAGVAAPPRSPPPAVPAAGTPEKVPSDSS
jgi:Amt family ammonium transporter